MSLKGEAGKGICRLLVGLFTKGATSSQRWHRLSSGPCFLQCGFKWLELGVFPECTGVSFLQLGCAIFLFVASMFPHRTPSSNSLHNAHPPLEECRPLLEWMECRKHTQENVGHHDDVALLMGGVSQRGRLGTQAPLQKQLSCKRNSPLRQTGVRNSQ